MKVNIQPQWNTLATWYWEQGGGFAGVGMSIWDMLARDYGAIKIYHGTRGGRLGMKNQSLVEFPDEKSYTMFLLRFG